MTEPDATDQTTKGAPNESTPPGTEEPGAAEAAVEFAEPEVVATPDPLEVAKADAAKYREQLLRTAADFDNFRKRTRRDNEDATRRGTEKALKELLPVFDNLERATTSAATAPDVKSVADGLRMIGKQFTQSLEKLGIKRIQAVGTPFDPSLHEAIQHVDSDLPPGVIAVEVQAGYTIGDMLLRAAMVAVSKGPATAAEAAAPETTAESGPASSGGDAPSDADEPKTDPPTEAVEDPKPSA